MTCENPAVAGGLFVIIWAMSTVEEEREVMAFDVAKTSNDESIPFAEAVKEIEDESDDYN